MGRPHSHDSCICVHCQQHTEIYCGNAACARPFHPACACTYTLDPNCPEDRLCAECAPLHSNTLAVRVRAEGIRSADLPQTDLSDAVMATVRSPSLLGPSVLPDPRLNIHTRHVRAAAPVTADGMLAGTRARGCAACGRALRRTGPDRAAARAQARQPHPEREPRGRVLPGRSRSGAGPPGERGCAVLDGDPGAVPDAPRRGGVD